jgi:hypothetical protein
MRSARIHTRIIQHPFAYLMQGARLNSFQANGHDIILDIHGLQCVSSEFLERNGKLFEKVICKYIRLKLCFSRVTKLSHSSFFTELENYPLDDSSRIIVGMYSWQQPRKQDIFYLFFLRDPVGAEMMFFAKDLIYERFNDESLFTFERDWSPAPPMPERLDPQPKYLHKRFGGDPITIKVNGRVHHHKLFIGGTEIQPKHRPQVNAVLNLGENPSRWAKASNIHSDDRAVNKGEGSQGMSVVEIREEANWVIDRLQKNQRVLVHCAAGMNRSTTICCAVLTMLEGLSAEDALRRVREHHPWAKPDSHHWLALRWLEVSKKE